MCTESVIEKNIICFKIMDKEKIEKLYEEALTDFINSKSEIILSIQNDEIINEVVGRIAVDAFLAGVKAACEIFEKINEFQQLH